MSINGAGCCLVYTFMVNEQFERLKIHPTTLVSKAPAQMHAHLASEQHSSDRFGDGVGEQEANGG